MLRALFCHWFFRVLTAVALISCSGVSQAIPTFEKVKADYQPSDSWLLARDGQVLQQVRVNHQLRRLQWVAIEDVSPALLQALLLSEDKRFYEHSGVDWRALAATSWRNVWSKRTRGASTLTMQLTRLLEAEQGAHKLVSAKRNVFEKSSQIASALVLDRAWRKDQILEAYLNLVSFRGELQGISAMSAGLFQKAPAALNMQEAAIAAVLIRAPNADLQAIRQRACKLYLQLQPDERGCGDMEGVIQLKLRPPFQITMVNHAPHLAQQLIHQAGQRVRTSVDFPLQQFANQQLNANLLQLEYQNAQDGAVLVLDNHTGEVLAWVGSSGKLSMSSEVDGVLAKRQAGSTLKPFLYGLAIQRHVLTTASVLDDSPVRIATPGGYYIPQNYDKQFVGQVSVRHALANSLNVPAVRTLLMVGGEVFYDGLHSFGLNTLTQPADYYGYSLALGGADFRLLDLTNAYRALANQGYWQPVSLNLGGQGDAKPHQALSTQASYIVADILSDNAARYRTFGLNSVLNTPYWTAVKTGTSKDMRDNWCVGFSRHYTVGVWVGNADGSPMHDVSGVTGAAPVWRAVIDYLHQSTRGVKSVKPPLPKGVSVRKIHYQPSLEADRDELFLNGTEQSQILLNVAEKDNGFVRIVYPGEGAIIALDPEIPPKLQKVIFKSTAEVANASWRLNGKRVNDRWSPWPGKYQLDLIDQKNNVVDSVHFQVRGAYLKQVTPRPGSH